MPRYKPTRIIDGLTYYQCNKCKEWFPIEGFYKDKRRSLGITSSCKKCHCKTTVETSNKAHKNEANRLYMRRKSAEKKKGCVVVDIVGEEWKPIEGHDSYFVSNKGRVKSCKWDKEILLKFSTSEKGYLMVCIDRETQRVHRLVASAFIPNPNGYEEINHKDENKENNRVENLEWCDRKYNMEYGTWKERRKNEHGY